MTRSTTTCAESPCETDDGAERINAHRAASSTRTTHMTGSVHQLQAARRPQGMLVEPGQALVAGGRRGTLGGPAAAQPRPVPPGRP